MSVDLTTYIKDDPNNRFVVDSDKVVVTNLKRGDGGIVSKDYGVDFFGDYTHTGRVKLTARDNGSMVFFGALTNTVDELRNIELASGDYLAHLWSNPTASQRIDLRECDGGSISADNSIGLSLNTDYYWKRVVTGTAATLFIYSDALMTILVDILSLTLGTARSYRYHNAVVSYGQTGSIPEISGEAGDFDLGLAIAGNIDRKMGKGVARGLTRGLG